MDDKRAGQNAPATPGRDAEGTRAASESDIWTLRDLPWRGTFRGVGSSGMHAAYGIMLLGVMMAMGVVMIRDLSIPWFFVYFLPWVPLGLLVGWTWNRAAAGRQSMRTTPEAVQQDNHLQGRRDDEALYATRLAVTRRVWPTPNTPRWRALWDECAAFGLSPPVAIVVDTSGWYDHFPGRVGEGVHATPQEVGRRAGHSLRRRALTSIAFATATVVAVLVVDRLRGKTGISPGFLGVFGAGTAAVAFLAMSAPVCLFSIRAIFRESLIAAPGRLTVRLGDRSREFRRQDSVLVVHEFNQHRSVVTMARQDGERVRLRYRDPDDRRLQALWVLWLHPGADPLSSIQTDDRGHEQ